jgi:hypothetical protein
MISYNFVFNGYGNGFSFGGTIATIWEPL